MPPLGDRSLPHGNLQARQIHQQTARFIGLTIRSSRDRFAASLVALSCSTPLGRCASRLNSGVRRQMGVPDTTEILSITTEPPRLRIRQHLLGKELTVELHANTAASFCAAFASANGESLWLRSLRGNLKWWQFGGTYSALVRAKQNSSRHDMWIYCSRSDFRKLQRVLTAEWAAA